MATRETIDLGKFPLGINNVSSETDLPEGSLSSAVNVDLDKDGNVRTRNGYTQVYSGSNIHSLYNTYFVEGSDLKEFDGTNATVIDTGLSLTNYLAWEYILGDYYYSDGVRNRIIGKDGWGVPTPANTASLTETSGLLDAGTYQITICFRNPNTGEIGGAGVGTSISVGTNAGILVSGIPDHPMGYDTVVYCSAQNGEEMYQNGIVANSLTNYTIINSRTSTRTLDTQHMEPLPGGHILRHFKARLYVANDTTLWFSQAFRYGLRKTAQDFFQFPSKIKIVQPVENGIFVVADKTYFLAGTEPKDMKQVIVSGDSAIEGTGLSVNADSFSIDSKQQIGFWYSNKGAVLGLPGGEIKNITEDRLALEESLTFGVSMLKEQDGIEQVITNFSNGGTVSGFAMGAEATSQIIRNGVVVP